MGYIDTHAHIDFPEYQENFSDFLEELKTNDVENVIIPGVNIEDTPRIIDLINKYDMLYGAIGVHPSEAQKWDENSLNYLSSLKDNKKIVAIGEIGLDYYWDTTYKEQQKEVLRRQLLLAQELNLPVILHNRNATEDILKILQSTICNLQSEHPLRGVFHCFNGSRETAEQILKMGFYLGIGGVITFKNCKLAETLKEIHSPETDLRKRLLLETDAPYMAPVPHRGERNESQWMIHVAERLAEVFDTTPQEICTITTQNAKQLFGI